MTELTFAVTGRAAATLYQVVLADMQRGEQQRKDEQQAQQLVEADSIAE